MKWITSRPPKSAAKRNQSTTAGCMREPRHYDPRATKTAGPRAIVASRSPDHRPLGAAGTRCSIHKARPRRTRGRQQSTTRLSRACPAVDLLTSRAFPRSFFLDENAANIGAARSTCQFIASVPEGPQHCPIQAVMLLASPTFDFHMAQGSMPWPRCFGSRPFSSWG